MYICMYVCIYQTPQMKLLKQGGITQINQGLAWAFLLHCTCFEFVCLCVYLSSCVNVCI